MSAGARTVSRLLDFFLPPACFGCGGPLPSAGYNIRPPRRVCPGCLTRLRGPPHPRCTRCGAPRGTGLSPARPCPDCHEWPGILVSARSAVILAPPADKLVHSLKYGGWAVLAEEMAGFMVDSARRSGYALAGSTLVPVPTTPRRRLRRGYNQARLLAGALARRAGGTLIDAMERRDERESQVSLPPTERRANVHGAFSLAHDAAGLDGMDLILVDDVLTTGATASAAAEVLEAGGAATVRLLTFARSIPEPW